MVIPFKMPTHWLTYDVKRLIPALVDAKAAVLSLTNVPYQRAWAERLQEIQLKQEVAGTSRIEGAEFTEGELDAAIRGASDEDLMTRSQKQARAAVNTYRWIAQLPDERPINRDLILEIHRRIVTGCDDDHCPLGVLRQGGQDLIFGNPRHRGVEGGGECERAFSDFCQVLSTQFRDHDILIQALASHYYMGAMHPFLDGNGRTARAMEALILQRAGLKDQLFIALSNYYYDEKENYLKFLSSVRAQDGDLTEFLLFGLRGVASQCRRLLAEINKNIKKALVRDVANELFERLASTRKRVIAKRQIAIINYLLEHDGEGPEDLFKKIQGIYNVSDPWSAFFRDIISLNSLGAVTIKRNRDGDQVKVNIEANLDWPTTITQTSYFESTRKMPRAKTFAHLLRGDD